MRRDDALLTIANLSVAALLAVAGPSAAIAAADPGGSHGNGGNSGSGKSGSGQSSASRGNSGNGGGAAENSSSGPKSSISSQTNNGNSSNSNGNGNGSAIGRANKAASGAQSNSGSDNPAAAPTFTPPNAPLPVVVAEQHVVRAPAGGSWSSPTAAPPPLELQVPLLVNEEGAADSMSVDHTGIPVWAAAEPVEVRGDLFGLAGLILMPLVGLAVGYRQAKAQRDAELEIGP